MAKAKCAECGAMFDGGPAMEQADIDKLRDAHIEKNHANKSEAFLETLKFAKQFAFAVANGTVPTRKRAKELLTQISKCLSEPVPPGLDDEPEPVAPPASPAPVAAASATSTETAGADAGKTSAPANTGKKK